MKRPFARRAAQPEPVARGVYSMQEMRNAANRPALRPNAWGPEVDRVEQARTMSGTEVNPLPADVKRSTR